MAAGFVMGRLSAPAPPHLEAGTSPALHALPVQAPVPNDPREMIPLIPGPGNQQPGQQPGQQGQGQGDCPILIYQDGQLYSFPRPGQQPQQGQQPGPGFGPGPGFPGGDPELIPLQPGLPSNPGLPGPSLPTPTEPTPAPPQPQNPSI